VNLWRNTGFYLPVNSQLNNSLVGLVCWRPRSARSLARLKLLCSDDAALWRRSAPGHPPSHRRLPTTAADLLNVSVLRRLTATSDSPASNLQRTCGSAGCRCKYVRSRLLSERPFRVVSRIMSPYVIHTISLAVAACSRLSVEWRDSFARISLGWGWKEMEKWDVCAIPK